MPDYEAHGALEGKVLLWATDFLTTFLLSAGMVFPCLVAYGVSGKRGFDFGAVLVFCGAASLVSTLIFTWKKGYWAAGGLLLAGGLIFWLLWRRLAAEWSPFSARAPGLADIFNASPGALFLLYALVVLTLGWVVVRVRTWWLAAALVVLPVLPAVQVGVLPAWPAILAGFAGWGSMLLTDLFDVRDRESLGRAKLLSLVGVAALVVLLVACLPMANYTRPQWATNARRAMILGVDKQLSRFFDRETLDNNFLTMLGLDLSVEDEGGGTGIGYGSVEVSTTGMALREDLATTGPRRYSGRVLMRLETGRPNAAGRLYLKGASFGNYTGVSWESGGVPEGFYPERFPVLTAPDAPVYTMHIRDTGFWGTWYYPYRYNGYEKPDENGRLVLGEEIPDVNDFRTSAAAMEGYDILYRPGGPEDGFVPLEDSAMAEERVYRAEDDFWTYLSLPGRLGEDLAALTDEIGRVPVAIDERLPERYREEVAAAARTAAWLASAAEYDPNTPAMGEDEEDFVLWFLEQERGYCVHFATAGAMLLRAQGIPARYVNGYVARLNNRGQGAVMDSDAHAWVEIYLDGYGWYPVEMTPGYAGGPSGVGLEGAAGTPESVALDLEDLKEDLRDKEEELEELQQQEEETPDLEENEDSAAPEEGEEAGGIAVPWKVLFVLAVLWGVLCAVYLLELVFRTRAMRDGNTNRSVLNAYGRYKRLRNRWGCGEDDELESLAKKAKFSQHVLTEKERSSAWKCLNEDVKQSRIGQPIRRRWILALLEPVF